MKLTTQPTIATIVITTAKKFRILAFDWSRGNSVRFDWSTDILVIFDWSLDSLVRFMEISQVIFAIVATLKWTKSTIFWSKRKIFWLKSKLALLKNSSQNVRFYLVAAYFLLSPFFLLTFFFSRFWNLSFFSKYFVGGFAANIYVTYKQLNIFFRY